MTSANIFESLVLQTIVAFVSVRIVLDNKLNLQVDTGTGCSPSLIDKLFICTLQSKMHRQILLGEFNLQLPRPIHIQKEQQQQQAATTADAQIPQSLFSRVHPPTPCVPLCSIPFIVILCTVQRRQCRRRRRRRHTHAQIQSQGLSLVRFASQSEINTNTNKNRNRSTRHSHRKKRKGKQCKARGETEREREWERQRQRQSKRTSEGHRSDCPTDWGTVQPVGDALPLRADVFAARAFI